MKMRNNLVGHFGKIYTISWSPALDTSLLSASQDGTMIVWNALRKLKNQIVRLDCQWVMACSFSANGNQITCGGLDNSVSIFPVQPGKDDTQSTAALNHHDGYISCIRFIDDSTVLTSSGDATCILWDLTHETPKTIFAEHTGDVMSVSIAGKDTFFSGGTDNLCKFWDTRNPKCVRTFEGHEADINSVVTVADGNSVITGSDDGSCKLFDVRSWSQLNVYASNDSMHAVTSVEVSKTGRLLFAGYDDCTVQVYDVVKGERINPILTGHHMNRVACLGLNKTGLALATGSWDDSMKIWA